MKEAEPGKDGDREGDSEKSLDPATENSEASNNEGSSGKPDKNSKEGEEEPEEESDKTPKPKGRKKKPATTTPKASPNQTLLTYLYLPTYLV